MGISTKADRYGRLKEQARKIQDEIDALREEILAAGKDRLVGRRFIVQIRKSVRSETDWRRIAEKLKASPRLIRGNTRRENIQQVHYSKREREG